MIKWSQMSSKELSERNQVYVLIPHFGMRCRWPAVSRKEAFWGRHFLPSMLTIPKNCSSDCYVDDTKFYMSFGLHDCKNALAAMNKDL